MAAAEEVMLATTDDTAGVDSDDDTGNVTVATEVPIVSVNGDGVNREAATGNCDCVGGRSRCCCTMGIAGSVDTFVVIDTKAGLMNPMVSSAVTSDVPLEKDCGCDADVDSGATSNAFAVDATAETFFQSVTSEYNV